MLPSKNFHVLRLRCIAGRRSLVTLQLDRSGTTLTESKPTLTITGFGPGFVPTPEQCLMIVNRSLRPLGEDGGPVKLKLFQNPAELFEDVLPLATHASGEGEVVIRLRNSDYLPYLPIARAVDEPEEAFDEKTRCSWAGVLLPVLEDKIVMLSSKSKKTLISRRLWDKIQWFPLHFRRFQPDVLRIPSADEDAVREVIQSAFPEATVNYCKEKLSFLNEAKGRKEKKKLGEPSDSTILLRCSFSEDVFALRKLFAVKGIDSIPQKTTNYDFLQAFHKSRYNNSQTSSSWVKQMPQESKIDTPESIPSTSIQEISNEESIEESITPPASATEVPMITQIMYSSYARAEDNFADSIAGPELEEALNMELLSTKSSLAVESFPDLEYEEEERSLPQVFNFRKDRSRRQMDAATLRTSMSVSPGSSGEEMRVRSSS